MTTRLIVAGEFRGNSVGWNSVVNMIDDEVLVYAGGPSPWNEFSIPHQFVHTTIEHNIFSESTHIHKNRYIQQWSSLRQTYESFSNKFNATDTVIKARNDILVEGKFIDKIEPRTIYVPEIEFHMPNQPFDIDVVCNDQILIGLKPTMDIYFQFSKQYIWNNNQNDGIEAVLRDYLRQQDIQIQTFTLPYKRHLN
jgi:hypothetical protein